MRNEIQVFSLYKIILYRYMLVKHLYKTLKHALLNCTEKRHDAFYSDPSLRPKVDYKLSKVIKCAQCAKIM